jgi:peptidoglycan/LPS O-acetylase OafA/YrhL
MRDFERRRVPEPISRPGEPPGDRGSAHAFRPDVEGLRALAVALVVLYHAGLPVLTGGFVGVDVFFVLSGFLITGLLLRERLDSGRTSFRQFYARRIRRILPAATLVLILTVVASYGLLGFVRGDAVARDGQWTSVFAANLRFGIKNTQYENLLTKPSPLQHYWSLGVEEQFYLVWPIVFAVVAGLGQAAHVRGRLIGALVALTVASFAWSIIQTDADAVWGFFSPLTRAWELGAGALLAVLGPSLTRAATQIQPRFASALSWGGIAAIVASAAVFSSETPFPGAAAAVPVFATVAVVAGGSLAPGAGAERLLAVRPVQWLGRRSYSMYLWHWPLLTIAAQRYARTMPWPLVVGLVVATIVLAALTFRFLENPVRSSSRLRAHAGVTLAIGAALVLAALLIATAVLPSD